LLFTLLVIIQPHLLMFILSIQFTLCQSVFNSIFWQLLLHFLSSGSNFFLYVKNLVHLACGRIQEVEVFYFFSEFVSLPRANTWEMFFESFFRFFLYVSRMFLANHANGLITPLRNSIKLAVREQLSVLMKPKNSPRDLNWINREFLISSWLWSLFFTPEIWPDSNCFLTFDGALRSKLGTRNLIFQFDWVRERFSSQSWSQLFFFFFYRELCAHLSPWAERLVFHSQLT